MIRSVICLLIVLICASIIYAQSDLDDRLEKLCKDGDLYSLFDYFQTANQDLPTTLFGLSALNLILFSNVTEAVRLHLAAKSMGTGAMPPLANLHLQSKPCGGMSDLFYVAAVTTKQLVDSNIDASVLKESLATLITLVSDTGLPQAGEAHLQHAIRLSPKDTSLRFRAVLMTPGIFESVQQIQEVRHQLEDRAAYLNKRVSKLPRIRALDEFVLSPTFYFAYQGYNDRDILTRLHDAYAVAYPAIGAIPSELTNYHTASRIRVGFVSSYYRRHSICKLFCDVIRTLARFHSDEFEVHVFSSLATNKEDDHTATLRNTPNLQFHALGRLLMSNRREVLSRNIDVLVYLDVGMDPASSVWAAGRLAPVQMCLWGHPTTTGMPHMDYYLSSDHFHRIPVQDSLITGVRSNSSSVIYPHERFREQLVVFDSLQMAFTRPQLQNSLELGTNSVAKQLTAVRQWRDSGRIVLLCPQFSPKLHPVFIDTLLKLIHSDHNYQVVLLSTQQKRIQWERLLRKQMLQGSISIMQMDNNNNVNSDEAQKLLDEQIVWVDAMNPQEYLSLLQLGHVMLDPFPFGGGVTMLEALAMRCAVVTAPALQTVPQLAMGMLRVMAENSSVPLDMFVAGSVEEYVSKVHDWVDVIKSTDYDGSVASQVLDQLDRSVYYNEDAEQRQDPSAEYAKFFKRALHSI